MAANMLTVTEQGLVLADGRTLHYYDTRVSDGTTPALAAFYSHGTPNIGEPPVPLFAAAESLGMRFLGYDRPGYGGSAPQPGRTVVSAVVCASGIAPYGASGLDYFAGMTPTSAAELRASVAGREALERELTGSEFDPEIFTEKDHAALAGSWSWLIGIAGKGIANGIGGMVDDDLAYVAPWGFEVTAVAAPTLVAHGEADRTVPVAHARWTAARMAGARLRVHAGEGHVSVLEVGAVQAPEWLKEHEG
jgi:hypothetical protein